MGSMVVPFSGLPWRILNLSHKKELPWSLWVVVREDGGKKKVRAESANVGVAWIVLSMNLPQVLFMEMQVYIRHLHQWTMPLR